MGTSDGLEMLRTMVEGIFLHGVDLTQTLKIECKESNDTVEKSLAESSMWASFTEYYGEDGCADLIHIHLFRFSLFFIKLKNPFLNKFFSYDYEIVLMQTCSMRFITTTFDTTLAALFTSLLCPRTYFCC